MSGTLLLQVPGTLFSSGGSFTSLNVRLQDLSLNLPPLQKMVPDPLQQEGNGYPPRPRPFPLVRGAPPTDLSTDHASDHGNEPDALCHVVEKLGRALSLPTAHISSDTGIPKRLKKKMGGQKSYRGQGGLWALLGRAHRVGPGVADGLHVGLILGQHAGLDKNGEPWIGVYSERAFNVQHGLAVLEHLDEGLQPGLQNGDQRR